MLQTPFHAYYAAMKLNTLQYEDALLPVYAEGKINVYPYKAAAALFAARNPYQKGVILCDEAGMGKSHETLLVISQSRYEGKDKILIAVPNPDLLIQWAEMISEKYSIPYIIMQNAEITMQKLTEFDGIVLATNDSIAQNIEEFEKVNWDIIVFE